MPSARNSDGQRRVAFLDRACAVLERSQDYAATVQAVASLAIPELADYCVVNIVVDGGVERAAIDIGDPADAGAVTEIRRYPITSPGDVLARALATGRSELLVELTDADYQQCALDDAHLALFRRLQFGSYL